jgi:hypothetical protein
MSDAIPAKRGFSLPAIPPTQMAHMAVDLILMGIMYSHFRGKISKLEENIATLEKRVIQPTRISEDRIVALERAMAQLKAEQGAMGTDLHAVLEYVGTHLRNEEPPAAAPDAPKGNEMTQQYQSHQQQSPPQQYQGQPGPSQPQQSPSDQQRPPQGQPQQRQHVAHQGQHAQHQGQPGHAPHQGHFQHSPANYQPNYGAPPSQQGNSSPQGQRPTRPREQPAPKSAPPASATFNPMNFMGMALPLLSGEGQNIKNVKQIDEQAAEEQRNQQLDHLLQDELRQLESQK